MAELSTWLMWGLMGAGVLANLPLLALLVDFGPRRGGYYAVFYYHFFMYPLLVFPAFLYFLHAPLLFALKLFEAVHPIAPWAFLGAAIGIALLALVVEWSTAPAPWELNRRHDIAKRAELGGRSFYDVFRSVIDEDSADKGVAQAATLTQMAIVGGTGLERSLAKPWRYSYVTQEVVSEDTEQQYRQRVHEALEVAVRKPAHRSLTYWVYRLAFPGLTAAFCTALLTIIAFGLLAPPAKVALGGQLNASKIVEHLGSLTAVLILVLPWLVARLVFQSESAKILSLQGQKESYPHIRLSILLIIAICLMLAGYLIYAVFVIDPNLASQMVVPLFTAMLSLFALFRPGVIEKFVSLFLGPRARPVTFAAMVVFVLFAFYAPMVGRWLYASNADHLAPVLRKTAEAAPTAPAPVPSTPTQDPPPAPVVGPPATGAL